MFACPQKEGRERERERESLPIARERDLGTTIVGNGGCCCNVVTLTVVVVITIVTFVLIVHIVAALVAALGFGLIQSITHFVTENLISNKCCFYLSRQISAGFVNFACLVWKVLDLINHFCCSVAAVFSVAVVAAVVTATHTFPQHLYNVVTFSISLFICTTTAENQQV